MPTSNSQSLDLSALPPHTALRMQIQFAGIKQFVIAQRIGMSEGQLSKILMGRRPLSDELAERIRSAIAGNEAVA